MALKIILGCWDVFLVVWVIGMFFTKRTEQRESFGNRLRYSILFLLAFWLLFHAVLRPRRHLFAQVILHHSHALNAGSVALAVLGLFLALWARGTLGKNWSGTVTFKENHELIERGPYALVRHPIYTAMLLMYLGTALALGRSGGLVGFPILFLSFWIKYRQEEALMLVHFGDQYRAYMKRVRALVPFFF
jgi:protein-S-isoprenylcysteine O-methyltransferase Ste14